jgi:hypothetical protein
VRKRETTTTITMSYDNDRDGSYTIKCPSFNGNKKEWLFFKTKMESYLSQKDCVELLAWNDEIPKDGDTWTAEELANPVNIEKKKVRLQNRKASGILLSSIDTTTERGATTFHMVDKFRKTNDGYAGGHFINAWKALSKRFEDEDTVSFGDLKQKYYDMKMKEDENPEVFITKLELLKVKLEKHKFKIDDKDFIIDVLAKLPKSKREGDLGPYQVRRMLIEEKLDVEGKVYVLDDLIR